MEVTAANFIFWYGMLNESLIAQRLNHVTESLEVQFALWGRDSEVSQSRLSLPLNEFVLELKQEADQVAHAINSNARHNIRWDSLQDKLSTLNAQLSHPEGQKNAGVIGTGADAEANTESNAHANAHAHVHAGSGSGMHVPMSPVSSDTDKYLLETIVQYMDILQFYHKMQLSMDHYHALVETKDYYSKLRGSVWKYTVIPLQFWRHGFQVSTLKSMFTAKTMKVGDLVNAKDLLATPTRLINYHMDDVSKKLTSEIDALLVSTGEQLSQFESASQAPSETSLSHTNSNSLNIVMSQIQSISKLEFSIPADIRIPPWYERQWFQLSFVSLYGPTLLRRLVQNGQSMWQLVSQGAYQFVSGLVENWIWTPLTQIWDTISYDSGNLLVTSPENLTSELNSLIRMIVEFLRDRSEHAGSSIDVDELTRQIMDGNLQQFMQIYEHQIESPVRSILFDNMARSLLIQLQKVKVDGSMAMNGINRLLKSQQLLFSIVSLMPALIIVWALRNFVLSTISSGVEWAKNVEHTKYVINRSLNEVERILNVSESRGALESHDQQMKSLALLNLEIATLRMVMAKYLPKGYRSIWMRDCNDLGDHKLTNEAKVQVINRIHHMYGKFM